MCACGVRALAIAEGEVVADPAESLARHGWGRDGVEMIGAEGAERADRRDPVG